MKRKKVKKLDLHSETLRQLESSGLEHVEGGITGTGPCSLCTRGCTECTKPCSVCTTC